jgi:hypothetical protein
MVRHGYGRVDETGRQQLRVRCSRSSRQRIERMSTMTVLDFIAEHGALCLLALIIVCITIASVSENIRDTFRREPP